MKLLKYLCIGISALSILSCSDWTSEEREVFENQEGMHRLIPLIEAQTEEDLTPTMREYFAQIREYRKTPHVKGFGWFGNWTGKGNNAQNYLKMLPDSVDFVSLWGTRGYLSDEQKADLKFFQEVKGGKALLCWIIQDLGDQLTPKGLNATQYWVEEKGQGNFIEGVKAYANAICDSIEKYNLDGFDIDYEPSWGYPGNISSHPERMHILLDELSKNFGPKSGTGRILMVDGEPQTLNTESGGLLDYYVIQAYYSPGDTDLDTRFNKLLAKFGSIEDEAAILRKTVWCEDFERHKSDGGPQFTTRDGVTTYSLKGMSMYYRPGVDARIGGVGAYRFNLCRPVNDYFFMREVIQVMNPAQH